MDNLQRLYDIQTHLAELDGKTFDFILADLMLPYEALTSKKYQVSQKAISETAELLNTIGHQLAAAMAEQGILHLYTQDILTQLPEVPLKTKAQFKPPNNADFKNATIELLSVIANFDTLDDNRLRAGNFDIIVVPKICEHIAITNEMEIGHIYIVVTNTGKKVLNFNDILGFFAFTEDTGEYINIVDLRVISELIRYVAQNTAQYGTLFEGRRIVEKAMDNYIRFKVWHETLHGFAPGYTMDVWHSAFFAHTPHPKDDIELIIATSDNVLVIAKDASVEKIKALYNKTEHNTDAFHAI